MHQHISVLNLMPIRLLVLTMWPTSSVFTNVTIGMGDDIHRRNASARMLSWGVISVFIVSHVNVLMCERVNVLVAGASKINELTH